MLKHNQNETKASEFLKFAIGLSALIVAFSYFFSVVIDIKKTHFAKRKALIYKQQILNQQYLDDLDYFNGLLY